MTCKLDKLFCVTALSLDRLPYVAATDSSQIRGVISAVEDLIIRVSLLLIIDPRWHLMQLPVTGELESRGHPLRRN